MASATTTTTTTTTTTVTDVAPLRIGPPLVVGLLGLASLWVAGLVFGHGRVQDDLRNRATEALTAAGYEGLTIGMTGRDATVTGTVATEADRTAVYELVRNQLGMRVAEVSGLTVGSGAAAGSTPASPATTAAPALTTAALTTAAVSTAAATTTAAPAAATTAAPVDAGRLQAALAIEPVYFATGSAALDARSNDRLDAVARLLADAPSARLVLVGHTDSTGNATANMALSLRRATAVRDGLVARGVASERLSVEARGQTQPAGSDDALNRRVTFELTG